MAILTPADSLANSKYASLVIDADTGVVLHEENAGKSLYPASLVKMMTLYMTFHALERGKLSMNKKIRVSSRASRQPASKLGLRRGSYISLQDAVLAVTIKSANDAAVVLAEAVGGSEWQFAILMNKMAKKLGMDNTNFVNASGLYNKRQKTNAYDMARLAVALRRDYPRYYKLFNRNKFYYRGRVYKSHNRVTKTYRGADGLKTGYINAAGYNLVTSARRSGHSIVGVVFGGRTSKRRDRHMIKLLDNAFYKVAKNDKAGISLHASYAPTPKLKPNAQYAVAAKDFPEPALKPNLSKKMTKASSDENSFVPPIPVTKIY